MQTDKGNDIYTMVRKAWGDYFLWGRYHRSERRLRFWRPDVPGVS